MRARLLEAIRSTAGGFPRPFWTLWAGALVNRIGTFVVPFLALYLTERRGLPVSSTGLVVSLWGLGSAASAPVGGWLADRIGRRPTMVGALALGGASMMALGLAERLEIIAPATLLVGFLGDLYRPGLFAAVSDLVPVADRARAFGLVYWAANLGIAVAVSLGGLLASVSYLVLFVADGATTLAFAAMLMAGLDGIENKTNPGQPLDKDIYGMSPEELKEIPKMPGSLDEALECLRKDHAFLLKGDVFTEDVIETWIQYKYDKEVTPIRMRPSPLEFSLYFDS